MKKPDFDFIVGDHKPISSLPITMDDAKFETSEQRFERFIRCVSRCIISCSMCEKGLKHISINNSEFDPHMQCSVSYREVAFVKYEPDFDDYEYGLFNNMQFRKIYKKYDMKLDDFYRTTMIKCKDGTQDCCPYFPMEISSGFPKLVILFDKNSADVLGLEYKVGKFQDTAHARCYCVDGPNKEFDILIKTLAAARVDHSIHSRLFQS